LAIEKVHGFATVPSSLHWVSDSEIVYPCARLVVLMDVVSLEQRFFRRHSAAVTAVAVSRGTQPLCASGQARGSGKTAEIFVWDHQSLDLKLPAFRYHISERIVALGFTFSGSHVISVGSDREATLAVWQVLPRPDVKKPMVPVATASAFGGGAVLGVVPDSRVDTHMHHFATFGTGHLKLWQLSKHNNTIRAKRASFASWGAPEVVTCVLYVRGDRIVAGGKGGELFFFEGGKAVRKMQLSKHQIAGLHPMRPASIMAVQGSGEVCLLTANPKGGGSSGDFELADLSGHPPAWACTPISSCCFRSNKIVTQSSTHLMLVTSDGSSQRRSNGRRLKLLTTQPSRAPTCLAAQSSGVVASGAMDHTVRLIKANGPDPRHGVHFPQAVTTVAFSEPSPQRPHHHGWLAIGGFAGMVGLYSARTLKEIWRRSVSAQNSAMTCSAFSTSDPEEAAELWLALGTQDGSIHTLKMPVSSAECSENSVAKGQILKGHATTVFQMQFAEGVPVQILMSVAVDGNVLAFDVPFGRRSPSVSICKDLVFRPWTLPVGWPVVGCWGNSSARPRADKSADLVSLPERYFCQAPHADMMLATDETTNSLQVFPYPAPSSHCVGGSRGVAHSARLVGLTFCRETAVSLSCDGSLVLWDAGGAPLEATQVDMSRQSDSFISQPRRAPGPDPRDTMQSEDDPFGAIPEQTADDNDLDASIARPADASGFGDFPEWQDDAADDGDPTGEQDHNQHNDSARDVGGGVQLVDDVGDSVLLPRHVAERRVSPPDPATAAEENSWFVGGGSRTGEQRSPGFRPPLRALRADDSQSLNATAPGRFSGWGAASDAVPAGVRKDPVRKSAAAPWTPPLGRQAAEYEDPSAIGRRALLETRRRRSESLTAKIGSSAKQDVQTAAKLAPSGCKENAVQSKGRYMYRIRQDPEEFVLEVVLPGGRLTKVSKSQASRTVTVHGEVEAVWTDGPPATTPEALQIVVPPGYGMHELSLSKEFAGGRAVVRVPRV